MSTEMRVRLFNMIAALFWKLGLPTQLFLWLAHPNTFRHLRVHRGAIVLASEIKIRGRVSVHAGTKVLCERLVLGRGIEIRKGASIVTREVILGDGVQIDDGVQAEGGFRKSARLSVGEGAWVFQNTILNSTCGLSIGNWSGIGGNCMIWTHGSWQSELDGFPTKYAATEIGNNVWLPWHVIVMPGVKIGDNSTLAAGSTIVKSIPANSLAVGSPATAIKSGLGQWPTPISQNAQDFFSKKLDEFMADPFYQEGHSILWRMSQSGPIRQLRVVWDEFGDSISGAEEQTLYICRNANLSRLVAERVAFLDIGHRRFSVPSNDKTIRSFLGFLTNFGIRGLDLSSGCPSHRC